MTLIRGKEQAAPLIQSLAYGETSMSTAVLTNRLSLDSVADTTLKAAARFWFVVAVIGCKISSAFTGCEKLP
jgi:hypothetical protein